MSRREEGRNSDLNLPAVKFSCLKDGSKGVAIGEEDWWIYVERNQSHWRFRLYDLNDPEYMDPLTPWLRLKDPQELLVKREAKILRKYFEERWGKENVLKILGKVVSVLQDSGEEFSSPEMDKEDSEFVSENLDGNVRDDPEIQQRALELLKDPTLLWRINKALDSQLYREFENRLFVFLAAVGAKIKTTMVRIRGENAAGKKMLYYWLPKLFGDENVYVISSASISWLKRKILGGMETRGKIFVLVEERGDFVGQIKYTFEQVKSEEKFVFGMSIRNERGEWEPVDIELQGPLCFITTTTEIETSLHSATREWEINPDESLEQTKGVDEWWRKRELLSDSEKKTEEGELRIIRVAISLLKPYDVRIPFIENIKFPLEQLADRRRARDFDDLIRFITLLYQYQRPIIDGKLYALPYDFEMAKLVASKILEVTRGNLTERERELYEAIKNDEIPYNWTLIGLWMEENLEAMRLRKPSRFKML